MIYVDNAATTQLDPEALEEMLPFLRDSYSNPSSMYSFARTSRQAIEFARNIIADCINAEKNEIFFTSGGSEADSWVISGIMTQKKENQGMIVTSKIEHHAMLNACEKAEQIGIKVIYLPVDSSGKVQYRQIENISDSINMASIMYVNNEIGTIQEISNISKIVHSRGGVFHTDAVQAIGHIPIDVLKQDIDMLSASAHKFNGPKGIGFLFKKNNITMEPLIMGGKQERGIRGGTENVASIVGMAIALKNNVTKMENNRKHISEMERYVRERLKSIIPGILFNGCLDQHIDGNISVSFKNISGEAFLHLMDLYDVCISTGSACNEGMNISSHVLDAINLPDEYKYGTIRLSIGKNNTMDEMKILCEKIEKAFEKLKDYIQ